MLGRMLVTIFLSVAWVRGGRGCRGCFSQRITFPLRSTTFFNFIVGCLPATFLCSRNDSSSRSSIKPANIPISNSQPPRTMAQTPPPSIPLICISRTRQLPIELGQSLAQHFTFPGIVDVDNYSPQAVRVLLATVNPYPGGVIVGGGVSVEFQQEVKKVLQAHNAAGRYNLKFVCIPVGNKERLGHLNGSKRHWQRSLVWARRSSPYCG